MLDLQALAGLLRDEELRQKLTRVASTKIKADIKSLQANAELSRRLIEPRLRLRDGTDPAEHQRLLKAIVNEHLDYFGTLIELSAAFSDRLLTMLAALEKDTAGTITPPALTMNLKGPLGGTLRAPFEIENNRLDPITAVFRLTPYVSEDGSQLVAANHAFDPPQAVVPPSGKMRVLLVQPIAEGFTAGRDYLATISVEGLDAMQILVRLRVEPPAVSTPTPASAAEPAAAPEPAPDTSGKAASPRRRTRSAERKSRAARPRPDDA
jgi:hypothetical protein